MSVETLERLERELPARVEEIVASHGLVATVSLHTGYPSVINEEGPTQAAALAMLAIDALDARTTGD